MRKMKPVSDMGYRPALEIKASATQYSTGSLLRILRHGGLQPRIKKGASHHKMRGKNAEAFYILLKPQIPLHKGGAHGKTHHPKRKH